MTFSLRVFLARSVHVYYSYVPLLPIRDDEDRTTTTPKRACYRKEWGAGTGALRVVYVRAALFFSSRAVLFFLVPSRSGVAAPSFVATARRCRSFVAIREERASRRVRLGELVRSTFSRAIADARCFDAGSAAVADCR